MKKIAVVTATRAEYGILRPLIFKLKQEAEFEVLLYVTGTHLSARYGNTIGEIEADNLEVYRRIPILEEGNTPCDISLTMANAIRGFAEAFRADAPDLLIVLGDRTEILGICCAAMNERIPIAHLHGGELTEGAVDDCVRHAVTKMSYLHFPAAEAYRQRIIQMGEDPKRVIQVGALGVENILNVPLLEVSELYESVGIPKGCKYVVVTFHPETLENETAESQVKTLIEAMKEAKQYFYLITKANADAGGQLVNDILQEYTDRVENAKLVASLGMVRYLSALKYSVFALGNSSSGIIEAPALGTPTVNIGNRQTGRLMAESIVCCSNSKENILEAMKKAAQMKRTASSLYGDGHTSDKIVAVVKDFLKNDKIVLKKTFYDMETR